MNVELPMERIPEEERNALIHEAAVRASKSYMRTRNLYWETRDEVMSDALFGAWQAALRWNGHGSLRGWCYMRAYGQIVDSARTRYSLDGKNSEKPWTLVYTDEHETEGKHSPFLAYDPVEYEAIEDGIFNNWLTKELLQLLDDKEWEIIIEFYVNGRSLTELGEVYGVHSSRICQIKNAALKRMRHYAERNNLAA